MSLLSHKKMFVKGIGTIKVGSKETRYIYQVDQVSVNYWNNTELSLYISKIHVSYTHVLFGVKVKALATVAKSNPLLLATWEFF